MKTTSNSAHTVSVHIDAVDLHGILEEQALRYLALINPGQGRWKLIGVTHAEFGGYRVAFAEESLPIPDFLRRTPKDAQPVSLTEHYYQLSQLAAQREAGHG